MSEKTRLNFYYSCFKSAAFFNGKQHSKLFWVFPQNGGKSRWCQINMMLFHENIKYKAKFTLPIDTNFVYRYVLTVYSIIFAGHPCLKISFFYGAGIGMEF